MKIILKMLLVFFASTALANKVIINPVKPVGAKIPLGQPLIKAKHFKIVEIDIEQLRHTLTQKNILNKEEIWLEIPLSEDKTQLFRLVKNTTMAPQLAAKFPQIQTYDGYNEANESAKFDITPKGFHAMIAQPGKRSVFIDPYIANTNYYIVYTGDQLISKKKIRCEVATSPTSPAIFPLKTKFTTPFSNCALKKYRLALAATYSYTQYTGGTKTSALATQVTTVNRINGIYEADAGITFELIANNEDIICDYQRCPHSPPGPEGVKPYTSGNPGALITENQINVDLVIGTDNYDIGHVVDAFPDDPNGLAGVGVTCNSNFKARGTTISPTPSGDKFDVDFLAHEMGHQFGGTHTQNNDCYRFDATAVEPGSGSTILGYAGICAPDVQENSGPYFHGITLQQMGTFTQNEATCSVNTPTPNSPMITGSNGNSIVPANTPFALNVSATTTAGTVLTYDWEQMDNEISPQPPQSISLGGPNFRSFSPTPESTRYFPNLLALANNGPFTWEVLSAVSRTMHFRATVRNNTTGGSCNAYQDYTVTVNDSAGPFEVTYPSGNLWQVGTQQQITWNVANTNVAPVNTPLVDILLSVDGGISYPITIAKEVPNIGSYALTIPPLDTTQGRIMVISSSGTFFNISPNNFAIKQVLPTLTKAIRNPMNTKSAFVYYANLPQEWMNGKFVPNGLPEATVQIDTTNQRFIINNILSSRSVPNVSIHILAQGTQYTTNPLTIPSILGKQ